MPRRGYGKFWSILNQTYWLMIRVAGNELRPLDLTIIQAAVLYWVKTSEVPPTPAELSRLLFRQPHTVSELLNRMQKQGLIKKRRDPKRKNVLRVFLTEKGERLFERQKDAEVIARIASALSPKEMENFVVSLEKLRRSALEEYRASVPLRYVC